MKNLEIRPGVAMAYEEHCFAPPWSSPQTVVMVHGNAESSRAWTGFVPHLVGKYRVVRPDMPGFGASAEPPGYRWQVSYGRSGLWRRAARDHRRLECNVGVYGRTVAAGSRRHSAFAHLCGANTAART